MAVTYLNPESMHGSPAFAAGALAAGTRTVYVGGQNGTDAAGGIHGDLVEQTEQALRNVLHVLAEGGAYQEDVVRLAVYLKDGADVQEGFAAAQEVWGNHAVPITVLIVAGLARPEALVEIEAIAVLP
ncbi:RidA family protein [Demequina sp. NBRC 110053]|uniref:RidA family protein n=1 Tax=Demequina sp. NBRC 110053 TaxID=1570342 RepID=UPI00190EA986|nr:RidA family protein [Demequina sp. NBRC 110053]